MFLFVISAYVLIGFVEITPLVKANRIKELILYASIFLAAFVVSLLLSVAVRLPSPAKPMDDLVTALSKLFSS
ncbi:hypothetical protein EDC14_1002139 [Hydrogenispora ethanolica]|jgi:hypothetical protein|uniref:Uncharacterized protein n=1 Tax=Hydrogenispora ethanolica TaxID=1082276 RepID=A0A4R1SBJ7_HYDET|nr:hypothetical protein [Hydrogenispora ethanolica]TCL76380.1 hypothetical protein EDC14_1002139 [Hydrogenispora ethanolica]